MTMTSSTSRKMPTAWLNGEFLPFDQARIPVYDLGFVQGATVTERLRTIRHQPYLVAEHLDRLGRSIEAARFPCVLDAHQLHDAIHEVARRHSPLISPAADLSIVVFVTAGQSLHDANGLILESRPTFGVVSAPLPLADWASALRDGVRLVTPAVRQVPANSLSPHIKHRSRLHWHLAGQQARASDPGATALLLDERGCVTETAAGNLFLVRDGQLLTPSPETTLPGIAQQHLIDLAAQRGWPTVRSDLREEDVAAADEAFLTSSTWCLLPVATINSRNIGPRLPGRLTKMFLDAWSEEVGLDFQSQAFSAVR